MLQDIHESSPCDASPVTSLRPGVFKSLSVKIEKPPNPLNQVMCFHVCPWEIEGPNLKHIHLKKLLDYL